MMEERIYTRNIGNGKKTYVAKELTCEFCEKQIIDIGYLFHKWGKGKFKSYSRTTCVDCLKARRETLDKFYGLSEAKQIRINKYIPDDADIVIFTPLETKTVKNQKDVYELADEELSSNPQAHKHLLSSKPLNLQSDFIDGRKLLEQKDSILDSIEYEEELLKEVIEDDV